MAARRTTTALAVPDLSASDEVKGALAAVEQLDALPAVTTDEEFAEVTAITRDLASKRKALDDKRKEITRPLLDSKRKVDELFNEAIARIQTMENAGRDALVAYKQMREREAAEARRAQEEYERQQRIAASTEEKPFVPSGFGAIRQISTMPPAPAPSMPVAAGFNTRKSYTAAVKDMQAFVAHCASTGAIHLLLPNQKLLDQLAGQVKDESPLGIPGVEIEVTESAVLR